MPFIVTDEGRHNRPKSARPFGVVLGRLLDVVAPLVRATQPGRRAAPSQQASQDDQDASNWVGQALSCA
jgi:hypothetical protein